MDTYLARWMAMTRYFPTMWIRNIKKILHKSVELCITVNSICLRSKCSCSHYSTIYNTLIYHYPFHFQCNIIPDGNDSKVVGQAYSKLYSLNKQYCTIFSCKILYLHMCWMQKVLTIYFDTFLWSIAEHWIRAIGQWDRGR